MNSTLLRTYSVVLAAVAGGCTLFVETDALQHAASGGASSTTSDATSATSSGSTGGDSTASGASTSGTTTSGSTSSSTGGDGGGGGGTGTGGQGDGGLGGAGGSGGGGTTTWCADNAPPDAFLCTDFDTPTTGLTSPPWTLPSFETRDGTVTLATDEASSPPASAFVDLVAATQPGCGYARLEKRLPGAPDSFEVQFDILADAYQPGPLIAAIDWHTEGGVSCSLILGVDDGGGIMMEQQFSVGSVDDTFQLPDSPLDGWHTFLWSLDLFTGEIELTVDGLPVLFIDEDDPTMDMSAGCRDSAVPDSIWVRVGPHCEAPPFRAWYDNILIAPR